MKLEFLMDNQTQDYFFEFIAQLDCDLIIMKNLNILKTKNPYDFIQENGYINFYIHSPIFGDLDIYADNNFIGFSELTSPIIFFNNSPIFEAEKTIKKGKIYIRPNYIKDNEIQKKSENLINYYNKISYWINKNIPLKQINTEFNGMQIRISDSIFNKIQNYKIL
ncbi:hypothetical protein [Campylobacter pinnipediorum]|uniref:hypothetical protein n=1 Tax=Campylobacter pinnipediorum TaxID=1965231 RepID=UPI00099580FE|nr:hypothetical protein [Campylobacter pinnipediorum]AQW81748.1 hypothetical protein CPIN17260_1466 [Campylobacter pinnipediorum subsp. pinnipediorum]AQW83424.1 hypothetical protein CPIN17261_1427 [Campylobacter pinnipediorum subsp. pinnipediorum]